MRTRIFKGLILFSLVIVFWLLISVISYASESDYKYTIQDDGTVKITKYIGKENDVIIPTEIEGYKVTCVGRGCFYGNTKINTVTIPESVTIIDDVVFCDCINLRRVDVYGDIIKMGKGVFVDCKEMKVVNFYGDLCYLPKKSFEDCENLEYVNLPEGIEYIGEDCFFHCYNLECLVLPNGLNKIEDWVGHNTKLVVVDIPDSVEYVGEAAFSNCNNLISLSVPDTDFEYGGSVVFGSNYNVKYNNINKECTPIDTQLLYNTAMKYMFDLGYKAENIEMRDYVKNALGIRAYFKTSPEEMYFICVNQDADGNADIIYTRKIDIFEYEKGDVNRDLNIDSNDALEILKHSANMIDLTYPNIRIGDFDSNGKASARDALTLLKYLAGITEEL